MPTVKKFRLDLAAAATFAVSTMAAPVTAGSTVISKPVAGQSTRIHYDWLQVDKVSVGSQVISVVERKRLAARISYHGNGSYICSPSGSGMKARCFTR